MHFQHFLLELSPLLSFWLKGLFQLRNIRFWSCLGVNRFLTTFINFINLLVVAILSNWLGLLLYFRLVLLLNFGCLLNLFYDCDRLLLLFHNLLEKFTCLGKCDAKTAWWIWFLTANTTVLRLLVCLSKNLLFQFDLLVAILLIQFILAYLFIESVSNSLSKRIMSDRWGLRHFVVNLLVVFFWIICLNILLELAVSCRPIKRR